MSTVFGLPACTCQVQWCPVFTNELARRGIKIRWVQLIGGGSKSGGTHSTGGAGDFYIVSRPSTMTLSEAWLVAITVARQMGSDAAWRRRYNWDGRGGEEHGHQVLRNCPHNGPARYQIAAVDAGYNGLGYLGHAARDDGPRPLSKRTWQQGIAWAKALQVPKTGLRFGQFNLPGEDKLPNGAARIKSAVALVKATPLAFVGWNELVGITSTGAASSHAKALDTALGENWHMVKPTLAWNENYISYDTNLLTLVKRYDDKILPATTGGRHVTRAVFKVKATGLVFAVGQTHLVNGSTAAHEADRQRQGGLALHYMQNVAQLHDDCPIILQGDMNTPKPLKAVADAGMKRTRTYADNAPTRDDTTYTNYAKTVPSTNLAQIIDHAYVSSDFYCIGYSVRRKLTSAGVYVKPRAGDHELVVSSVRHPA